MGLTGSCVVSAGSKKEVPAWRRAYDAASGAKANVVSATDGNLLGVPAGTAGDEQPSYAGNFRRDYVYKQHMQSLCC